MQKFIIIFGFLLIVWLVLEYLCKWSPDGQRATRNYENSQKIEIGMPRRKMLSIMGKPDKLFKMDFDSSYKDTTCRLYFYNLGFGAADGINIVADSTHGVIKLYSAD